MQLTRKQKKPKNNVPDLTDIDRSRTEYYSRVTLAERSFWSYCQFTDGSFYRTDRPHLVELCDVFDRFHDGRLYNEDGDPYRKLIVNMPPRHGKTRTLINYCMYALGRDNEERIIATSYNDDTAGDFSRYTRDGIERIKNDPFDIVFNDVFPGTKIRRGQASYNKWALEGQHFNYLGAGIGGSITSKGGSLIIVDDPVKGAVEAYNANVLDKIWLWYTSTLMSRIEGGEPREIIVMTRWAKKDIIGRLQDDEESDFKKDWYVHKIEARDEESGVMLCEDLLTEKRYFDTKKKMDRPIFRANYHQEPIDILGALYQNFEVYDDLPTDDQGRVLFKIKSAYCDSADTGDDWLCLIVYGVYMDRIYILDIYYTGDAMEVTELKTAEVLDKNEVNIALFESNGAGRGFARNVRRIMYSDLKTKRTSFRWFHQSFNKESRIFTWSAWLQDNVLFPRDWGNRWSKFHDDVMGYTKEQPKQNDRDDGPDALTGIAEEINKKIKPTIFNTRV